MDVEVLAQTRSRSPAPLPHLLLLRVGDSSRCDSSAPKVSGSSPSGVDGILLIQAGRRGNRPSAPNMRDVRNDMPERRLCAVRSGSIDSVIVADFSSFLPGSPPVASGSSGSSACIGRTDRNWSQPRLADSLEIKRESSEADACQEVSPGALRCAPGSRRDSRRLERISAGNPRMRNSEEVATEKGAFP